MFRSPHPLSSRCCCLLILFGFFSVEATERRRKGNGDRSEGGRGWALFTSRSTTGLLPRRTENPRRTCPKKQSEEERTDSAAERSSGRAYPGEIGGCEVEEPEEAHLDARVPPPPHIHLKPGSQHPAPASRAVPFAVFKEVVACHC